MTQMKIKVTWSDGEVAGAYWIPKSFYDHIRKTVESGKCCGTSLIYVTEFEIINFGYAREIKVIEIVEGEE